MPARDVETILLKQLASCLAMPMFVIGADGDLLFFNESAEGILGRRYDEWQAMERHEWGSLIRTYDVAGNPLPDSERPLLAAMDKREPAHNLFYLASFDGRQREVEGTAVPLVATGGASLGALGRFWEPRGEPLGELDEQDAAGTGGQHELEVILMRRLAAYLATPIFIQHQSGELLYFNTAAEPILGIPFEQVRVTPRHELYAMFQPRNVDGTPIESDDHPLNVARKQCRPAHRRFWISGLDEVPREIECTAFPLSGQSRRMLGSVGFFWEIGAS